MLKRILIAFALGMAVATAVAQVTTSSISGSIKSKSTSESLAGATITATHVPTGTVYRTIARKDGSFDIHNAAPGGPYTIEITYSGFETEKRTDIFLALGEISRVDADLIQNTGVLSEVVVAASTRRPGNKGGTQTNIGRDKIANLPSVGRNLNDYVRYTPQTKITANGGISFVGQNNRYNSFMIDGAVNNDVFGLSEQGTNGGRANVPPISIDAIDRDAGLRKIVCAQQIIAGGVYADMHGTRILFRGFTVGRQGAGDSVDCESTDAIEVRFQTGAAITCCDV